jgi:hypothetical protein
MTVHDNFVQNGFIPILNKSETAFSDSAKYVMSLLGSMTSDSLLSYAAKNLRVSQDELFKNPDLLIAALQNTVGSNATKTAVKEISETISQKFNSKYDNLPLSEILENISKEETLEFLQRLNTHDHVLCVFSNEITKISVMEKFFKSSYSIQTPKIISAVAQYNDSSVQTILFDSIIAEDNSLAIQNFFKSINEIHSSNQSEYPTKLVCDEVGWWYENSLNSEHCMLEKEFGPKLKENMIRLCMADKSKINHDALSSLFEYHNYIMLDDPFQVYRTPNSK